MKTAWFRAAMLMSVLVAVIGTTPHAATPAAGTATKMEKPPEGWPAYCKTVPNQWTATAKLHQDPCEQKIEVDCLHECKWENGKCEAVLCPSIHDQKECIHLSVCSWDTHGASCIKMPAPPLCDQKKEERDCRESREQGCIWVQARGLCLECTASTESDCKNITNSCMWEYSDVCGYNVHYHEPACAQYVSEVDCDNEPGCEWNTTTTNANKCQIKEYDCQHFNTNTTCLATDDACSWHGVCKPEHVDCKHIDNSLSCGMESQCFWKLSSCAEPDCGVAKSQIECNALTEECSWTNNECVFTNRNTISCTHPSKTINSTTCTPDGCVWEPGECKTEPKVEDCLKAASEFDCQSHTDCKWEQEKCEAGECIGKALDQCKLVTECEYTDHEGCTKKSHVEHADHGEHPPPYNILVIFVIGAVGAFFRHNFSNSRMPYTVILFIFGAAFDGIAQIPALDTLQNFTDLAGIDPHLLFYIFLPVLIFESAYAVDWFVFKTVMWHCILLAGPGICVASGLTALGALYVFPYNWSLEASILFGVTLSATDPVAVVALLKELGAPAQISTLIEGESLLNDGTAIVFFTILQAAISGCTGQIEEKWYVLVLEFIKVALGGPLLGYACGWVSVFCLSRVFNDPLIEITTSLVTAYVTFFVAEAYCHVSGVLAVVACGIYMSHRKQCISPEVHHTLHEFWEMSVYLANTLIFTMSGMIVAGRALKDVQPVDALLLAFTYLLINIVRGLTLYAFSFIYNRFEYKLDTGSMLLVIWGGLRGAVGLALALIVAGDSKLKMRDPDDPRSTLQIKLVFFVAGIVVLTLLVNGVSTRNLVKKFRLDEVSDTKKRMMKENFRRLKEGGMDQLEDLKIESALYDVNWLVARKWVFDDLRDPYNTEDDLGEGDQHAEAIMHYFKIMHSSVWDQNEEGLLNGDSVRFLLAKINEREKIAKEKDKLGIQAEAGFGQPNDSYLAMPNGAAASPMSPGSPQEMNAMSKTTVHVQHLAGGRNIDIPMDPSATVYKLKQKIYNEENIPVDQQKIVTSGQFNRLVENNELIESLHSPGQECEVSLDRLNPDEDILLNANILEEFWDYDRGLYGKLQEGLDKIKTFGKLSRKETKWTFGFNVAMALVMAHDAVLAKIDNLADPGEANKLKTHAKQVKKEVLSQLVAFAGRAPETSIAMKTTLAARTVLNHARKKVWDWQKEGLIEDKEVEILVSLVEKKMKALTKADPKMQPCNPDYILSQMEWYENASPTIKKSLRDKRKVRQFKRGQLLIEKGDEHGSILLITAGSARVHVSRRFDYVGPGYTAGLLSSLTGTTKFCDIYAETDLKALYFKAETILSLITKGNETFAQALWRTAGVDLAYKVLRGKEPYSKWAPREVRKFVNKGRLLELPKYRSEEKKIPLSHGCYHILMSGTARDATNQSKDAKIQDLESIQAPALLPFDCHEAYLQTYQWKITQETDNWFNSGESETREDEVHLLVVEDPSSASARARRHWEKIYKKIRNIKNIAALRGADVKTALAEAFAGDVDVSKPKTNPADSGGVPSLSNGLSAPLLMSAAS